MNGGHLRLCAGCVGGCWRRAGVYPNKPRLSKSSPIARMFFNSVGSVTSRKLVGTQVPPEHRMYTRDHFVSPVERPRAVCRLSLGRTTGDKNSLPLTRLHSRDVYFLPLPQCALNYAVMASRLAKVSHPYTAVATLFTTIPTDQVTGAMVLKSSLLSSCVSDSPYLATPC